MRSKEVEKAINDLMFIVVTDIYDNEVSIDKTKVINEYSQSVGTVLDYIKELEKDVKDAMDGYQDLGKEVYFNFISKDKIKDKIKELENMRDTSITSEAFNIFNGEIIVLKELLEEEYEN